MGSYAIAIGGSGARCLESLVHLCAVGLGPDKLFVLIIDPDDGHWNIERLRNIVKNYQNCRIQLGLAHNLSIFKTDIEFSVAKNKDYLAWSPVFDEKNLRQYFQYDSLISAPKESERKTLGDIARLLYSEKELDLKWDRGFHGRSSVGAPVMAKIKENLSKKPWYDLIQGVKNDMGKGTDAKIFVLASIFGATGASGFPTIGQILREKSQGLQNKERLFLGGALLLPYFSFPVPPEQKEIYATPENFLINTKAALKHYSFIWKEASDYDAIYFVGDRHLDSKGREFGLGGRDQKNFAHYVELIAALSASDFYQRKIEHQEKDQKGEKLQFYVGRTIQDAIDWADLPHGQLRSHLLFFTTFAFAYRVFYLPLLRDDRFVRNVHLSPWYVDHFKKHSMSLMTETEQTAQDELKEYLIYYLEWLYQIHSSTTMRLKLLNHAAFQTSRQVIDHENGTVDFLKMLDFQFRSLLHSDIDDTTSGYKSATRYGFDEVWENLCKTGPAQIGSSMGRFVYMCYKACERFCEKNYDL